MRRSKNKTAISLSDFLAPRINSRDVATILKDILLKESSNSLDLDFSNIDFVSRSAAHELLSMKNEFYYSSERRKKIYFINTQEAVSEMLRIVAANRALPKNSNIDFNPKEISLETFLSQLVSA